MPARLVEFHGSIVFSIFSIELARRSRFTVSGWQRSFQPSMKVPMVAVDAEVDRLVTLPDGAGGDPSANLVLWRHWVLVPAHPLSRIRCSSEQKSRCPGDLAEFRVQVSLEQFGGALPGVDPVLTGRTRLSLPSLVFDCGNYEVERSRIADTVLSDSPVDAETACPTMPDG